MVMMAWYYKAPCTPPPYSHPPLIWCFPVLPWHTLPSCIHPHQPSTFLLPPLVTLRSLFIWFLPLNCAIVVAYSFQRHIDALGSKGNDMDWFWSTFIYLPHKRWWSWAGGTAAPWWWRTITGRQGSPLPRPPPPPPLSHPPRCTHTHTSTHRPHRRWWSWAGAAAAPWWRWTAAERSRNSHSRDHPHPPPLFFLHIPSSFTYPLPSHTLFLHIPSTRGVTVSMSAFLACHQCYCAGSSLAWGLNLRAVVCGIFWSSSPGVFSGYSGFLPSFIGSMVQPIK